MLDPLGVGQNTLHEPVDGGPARHPDSPLTTEARWAPRASQHDTLIAFAQDNRQTGRWLWLRQTNDMAARAS